MARIPDTLDDARAAALPLAGLTAWQALFNHGGLAPGQTVLIHGAGGGTGTLAVQLAHNAGARVIATGRGRSEERARQLGADMFIDLERQRFEQVVGPVDVAFDTIGGDVLHRSATVVKPGGTLVSITAPPPVHPHNAQATFFIVEPNRDQLVQLAQRAGEERLRPHIGASYPLADTREAFEAKQRGIPGKVVLYV